MTRRARIIACVWLACVWIPIIFLAVSLVMG